MEKRNGGMEGGRGFEKWSEKCSLLSLCLFFTTHQVKARQSMHSDSASHVFLPRHQVCVLSGDGGR